ncbi:MAG: hypothetical protein ACREA3_08220 [Nitrosotalea sp.]
MTLVIAALGQKFVVLGTDSRGTIDFGGNRVELNSMKKLTKISKHVRILMYGDAEYADYIIEEFKKTLKGKNHDTTEIAKKLAEMCREEGRKVNDVPATYLPLFGLVIAGLDKKGGEYVPRCYVFTSATGFRLRIPKHGFALEGKTTIAYYLFAKNYQKDMDVDKISSLVAQTLYDTISVDGDVGGKIRIVIIEKSGIREIPDNDINELIGDKWGR